jgi:hypothetical protein
MAEDCWAGGMRAEKSERHESAKHQHRRRAVEIGEGVVCPPIVASLDSIPQRRLFATASQRRRQERFGPYLLQP